MSLKDVALRNIDNEFEIKSFNRLRENVNLRYFAEEKVDGNPCSIIKVKTGNQVDKIDFLSGESTLYNVEAMDSGEYWLYVAPGENSIKILAQNHVPANISLGQIEAFYTYLLELDSACRSRESQAVYIFSTPADAEKIVDGISHGISNKLQLVEGEHELILRKKGYGDFTEQIQVISGDNCFRGYKMQELDPCPVRIYSEPEDASIYVDEQFSGKTNSGLFLYSGKYNLKLKKKGFLDFYKSIDVSEDKDNKFCINLETSIATLNISVEPGDALVYINDVKHKTENTISLEPGVHHLLIKKSGYTDHSRMIEILGNETKCLKIEMLPQTGKLQMTVKPLDTVCRLKQNNETIREWVGMELLKDLEVGDYSLECHAAGYEEYIEHITIQNTETVKRDILLQEDADQQKHMVLIKAGEFTRSNSEDRELPACDEKQEYKVVLTRNFYMSKVCVTRQDYMRIMNKGKISNLLKNSYKKKFPKESINWFKAIEYCNKLSLLEGLMPCYSIEDNVAPESWTVGRIDCNFNVNGYRLPTEAEWEYAARGGQHETGNYKYSGSNNVREVAWVEANSVKQVAGKKTNKLGLYDMSGNLQEWCWDNYGEYSSKDQTDPKGPSAGHYKITRGGSWQNNEEHACVSHRDYCSPFYGHRVIGFRIVNTHK